MAESVPILVSTDWLAAHLQDDDVHVFDATKHLPAAARDAHEEYEAEHIPGALFFDLDGFTDTQSEVPAALPTAEIVAQKLADLGANSADRIVLYDDSGVKTSARVWFALTAQGVENVSVLDGGIAKWRAEGRPVSKGTEKGLKAPKPILAPTKAVRTKAEMLANVESRAEQVVDARSADRVFGDGADPVHGGQNGRIPGALNVPFNTLFNADGTYKSPDELRSIFDSAGVDLARPIVTSCGSGVTASVLLFALALIGKHDTALYDGSWQEWSADPQTPKAQGPRADGE